MGGVPSLGTGSLAVASEEQAKELKPGVNVIQLQLSHIRSPRP